MQARPRKHLSFTSLSLLALAAGVGLGTLGHASGAPAFTMLEQVVKPLGSLWTAALQLAVLPLIVLKLLAAIVGAHSKESVGRLGLRALLLFVTMLVAAGLLTLVLTPPLVALYKVDPRALATLETTADVSGVAQPSGAPASLGSWVGNLIPRNLFAAAAKGDLLPILLFTAIFALAVTRLPDERRLPLTETFQGLSAAMFIVVRWILLATPIGVFALTYSPALRAGAGAAGMLGAFIILACVLLALMTVLLYPITAIFGRLPMRTFARAVAPAQLVAISTRSSIASLPALVDGATRYLRLPAAATSFVLPLTVSVFKMNRTVSTTAKLFFIAHIYNLPVSAGTYATFLVTVILLSFTSAGVPDGGSSFATLPAYLAAGMPIEAVVVLEATTTIPDIFKTLLNVTGDMSAAVLLSRSTRTEDLEGSARADGMTLVDEDAA
jgi:Na+/H+-dicarboxylate symporter